MTLIAASNYPFLNIFWTILIFFAWVAWIWIAITVLIDLFRRRDIGGWAKALWVVFVIVLPFIGVAAEMRRRGHDVILGSAERFRTAAEKAGVPFEVVRYDAECGITVRIGGREIPIVPWVAPLIYATEEPPE